MDEGKAPVKKAFFLDRDGTINIDHVYIADPARIELIPGAAAAIRRARAAVYLSVVVTNQSGVARGLIRPEAMPEIHRRLDELLELEGAKIDDYRICVHHPDTRCECRKPSPFLVDQAARELGIDVAQSIFVGDKLTDVGSGKNAHCRFSILLRTGKGVDEEKLLPVPANEQPDHVADDLAEAVDWVLRK